MKLKVIEITPNDDGTSNIVFDCDEEFIEYVKERMNNDSPSEEELSAFVSSLIQRNIDAYKQQVDKEGEDI